MAISPTDGTLYWLEPHAGLIVAASGTCTLHNCYKRTIVTSDIDERSFGLEASSEYLVYVTGRNSVIRRNLDGTDPVTIFSPNILLISSITLHDQTVFIATAQEDKEGIRAFPISKGNALAVHEPTDTSKQPIRSRYLSHVTGYQPIRDLANSIQYTHIWFVTLCPYMGTRLELLITIIHGYVLIVSRDAHIWNITRVLPIYGGMLVWVNVKERTIMKTFLVEGEVQDQHHRILSRGLFNPTV
eukprot:sb/3468983/